MQSILTKNYLDKDTYVIQFEPKVTDNGQEQVVIEYHLDEHVWVSEMQYFDNEGNFTDSMPLINAVTPYEEANYMSVAVNAYEDTLKGEDNGCGTAWEDIVVSDEYKCYDALIDRIKGHYGNGDANIEIEVEDYCHASFMQLIGELDKKFGSPYACIQQQMNEVFDDFDTDVLCISDFNIEHNGATIDYVVRDDKGNISLWCGGHPYDDDKNGEELKLSIDNLIMYVKEILNLI